MQDLYLRVQGKRDTTYNINVDEEKLEEKVKQFLYVNHIEYTLLDVTQDDKGHTVYSWGDESQCMVAKNTSERPKLKVTMTMDEETAQIVITACENWSRFCCGQFDPIVDDLIWNEYTDSEDYRKDDTIWERRDIGEACLTAAKKAFFPKLHISGNYGLGFSRSTDIAFDVHHALESAIAWHRQPGGGWTTDFSMPMNTVKKAPIVTVEDVNDDPEHNTEPAKRQRKRNSQAGK